ncbi:MAG: hypothetical protein ACLP00_10050 [Terracidiphilus sp.]
MKRAAVFGSSLLLAATTLAAQSSFGVATMGGLSGATPPASQENAKTATNFDLSQSSPTCPVSMHALQGSGTGLVAVHGDQRAAGFAQRIHLILNNPKAAKIAAAKVRVFGLSGKNRVEPASYSTLDLTNQTSKFDLSRTLDVAFTTEGEKDVATDLILPGFTTVLSIQLESLTYKDGSTWAVAGRQACHVAPDPLVLVADR